MASRDTDDVLIIPADLPQKHGTFQHGDMVLDGIGIFRIGWFDSRRIDDKPGPFHMCGVMADLHRNAALLEGIREGGLPLVGTRNRIAQIIGEFAPDRSWNSRRSR